MGKGPGLIYFPGVLVWSTVAKYFFLLSAYVQIKIDYSKVSNLFPSADCIAG